MCYEFAEKNFTFPGAYYIYFLFFKELDYIMITGDFPAHDVWRQSRQLNLAHTKKMAELVTSIFPDKLILPTVGNHESFPMNR